MHCKLVGVISSMGALETCPCPKFATSFLTVLVAVAAVEARGISIFVRGHGTKAGARSGWHQIGVGGGGGGVVVLVFFS